MLDNLSTERLSRFERERERERESQREKEREREREERERREHGETGYVKNGGGREKFVYKKYIIGIA